MHNSSLPNKDKLQNAVSKLLPWIVIVLFATITLLLWRPIVILLTSGDTVELEAGLARLGILAPTAFLALSVIQVVGAPIPGYPIQFLGGALFGPVWGGVYGVVGLVAGGVLSAWLARTLGQPFIERHVGAERLARYQKLAKLETLWVWVIILLVPVGDVPYYIAGLSRVRLGTLTLAILLSRGPFTFLIAWIGATSVQAPAWMFIALIVAIVAVVALGYVFRDKVSQWFDDIVRRLG